MTGWGRHRIRLAVLAAALAIGFITVGLSRPGPTCARQTADYDLDGDQVMERYVLADHQLVICEDDRELWRSPADWRVTSFHITDVTHDGRPDLLLVVWKKGSFGTARPFWHTGPNDELTCHLYVYNLVNKDLKPRWMSSALDQPIKDLGIADIDGDGLNELLVTGYGNRRLQLFKPDSPEGEAAVWQWRDWGFYRWP